MTNTYLITTVTGWTDLSPAIQAFAIALEERRRAVPVAFDTQDNSLHIEVVPEHLEYHNILDATLALLATGKGFDSLPSLDNLNVQRFFGFESPLELTEGITNKSRDVSQTEVGILLGIYTEGLTTRAKTMKTDPEGFYLYLGLFQKLATTLQTGMSVQKWMELHEDLIPGPDEREFEDDESWH